MAQADRRHRSGGPPVPKAQHPHGPGPEAEPKQGPGIKAAEGPRVMALTDHGLRPAVPRLNYLSKLKPVSRNRIRPF